MGPVDGSVLLFSGDLWGLVFVLSGVFFCFLCPCCVVVLFCFSGRFLVTLVVLQGLLEFCSFWWWNSAPVGGILLLVGVVLLLFGGGILLLLGDGILLLLGGGILLLSVWWSSTPCWWCSAPGWWNSAPFGGGILLLLVGWGGGWGGGGGVLVSHLKFFPEFLFRVDCLE